MHRLTLLLALAACRHAASEPPRSRVERSPDLVTVELSISAKLFEPDGEVEVTVFEPTETGTPSTETLTFHGRDFARPVTFTSRYVRPKQPYKIGVKGQAAGSRCNSVMGEYAGVAPADELLLGPTQFSHTEVSCP